jgi:5-methyltetrahydrofolate--homocysteine methyltransferase
VAFFEEIASAVIAGDPAKSQELVKKALDGGAKPLDIVDQGLMAGMNVVGERFKRCDMFVPEVLMAAKAMNMGLDLVKPHLDSASRAGTGTVVIGTVKGDLHDIGKNLVAMLLESKGLNVVNLGVDVSAETFVNAVKQHSPQIVGMSALLTTTMLVMKDVIDALKEANLRDSVKVMIGGAPVTQDFATEIGADGYAPDAVTATDLAKGLLG